MLPSVPVTWYRRNPVIGFVFAAALAFGVVRLSGCMGHSYLGCSTACLRAERACEAALLSCEPLCEALPETAHGAFVECVSAAKGCDAMLACLDAFAAP